MRDLNHIADISVDISDGSCWVGHSRRISRYSPEGTLLFTMTLEKGSSLQALASDPSSKALWIGTNKGLVKIDTAGIEQFRTDEPVHINDLKTDTANGSLWLITDKQVFKYTKEGKPLFALPLCSNDDDDKEQLKRTANEKNKNKSRVNAKTNIKTMIPATKHAREIL